MILFCDGYIGKSVTAIKAHNSAWLDGGFYIFIFGSEDYGKFELRAHKYWMLQDKLGGSIKDFKSDVDSFKNTIKNMEYLKENLTNTLIFYLSKRTEREALSI